MSKIEHFALIPDGARRWASKNNKTVDDSYQLMVLKVFSSVEYIFNREIKEFSVYFASIDNFCRNQEAINSFCKAESLFFQFHLPKLRKQYNIYLNVVGNLDILPIYFKETINRCIELNQSSYDFKLNICLAYSPIIEIQNAIVKSNGNINFFEHLAIKTPIDILVRTGKENCISNFLPLQNGYSRIFFLKKYMNDFKRKDIQNIIEKYYKTERRFGK